MSETRDMERQRTRSPERVAGKPEAVLTPPVDIFEDEQGISLRADLPGVSRERLDLQIDNDTLTIEGEAAIDMPGDMKALYADVRSTRYRRRFTLSRELATDRVQAQMRDGVLTIRIPRREEHRPRRIEISTH